MTKKITLLNTRPSEKEQLTQKTFEKHGFKVINFPCIEISCNQKNKDTAIKQLCAIASNDTLIFTSQHAVRCAFNLFPQWQIPNQATVIALGSKTSECLKKREGIKVLTPEQQNSEGVIELLQSLNSPSCISLVTAKHGRNQIQHYAHLNGIALQQINVYYRQLPKTQDHGEIEKTKNLYILATSVTTLENLQKLLSPTSLKHVQNNTLICASERIARAAKKQGFEHCLISHTANPERISAFLLSMLTESPTKH